MFLDGLGKTGLVLHLQSPEPYLVFNELISAPASIPASLSRVHLQPPGDKKRSASDAAIDVQSEPCARKCKHKMNDQGGPM